MILLTKHTADGNIVASAIYHTTKHADAACKLSLTHSPHLTIHTSTIGWN